MTLAELWWRSRLRHALRRWVPKRRRLRPAEVDDADEPERVVRARASPAQRAAAIALGTLFALLGAELLLRVPNLPLPRDLSTYLFQCYYPDYEPAKILFESEQLYINLHKPNFEAKCHWNGYTWRHRSDAWGGRNPETWSKVDIVLLGDSMIYGHGVEEEQTTAHFLRERLGVKVSNLAVMGDSFPQYLARLRNLALPLQPRVVFVFLFGNDISDVIKTRTLKMTRRFVWRGEAPEAGIYAREMLLGHGERPSTWLQGLEHRALLYRTLRFFLLKGERAVVPGVQPVADFPSDTEPPNSEAPSDIRPRERLAFRYLEAALGMMKDSANRAGTELVVVYLPALSQRDSRQDRLLFRHGREIAFRVGLRFVDGTSVQYTEGRPVPGARLEYDGHLTEAGHRRLAGLLADYIERNALLKPARD